MLAFYGHRWKVVYSLSTVVAKNFRGYMHLPEMFQKWPRKVRSKRSTNFLQSVLFFSSKRRTVLNFGNCYALYFCETSLAFFKEKSSHARREASWVVISSGWKFFSNAFLFTFHQSRRLVLLKKLTKTFEGRVIGKFEARFWLTRLMSEHLLDTPFHPSGHSLSILSAIIACFCHVIGSTQHRPHREIAYLS